MHVVHAVFFSFGPGGFWAGCEQDAESNPVFLRMRPGCSCPIHGRPPSGNGLIERQMSCRVQGISGRCDFIMGDSTGGAHQKVVVKPGNPELDRAAIFSFFDA